MECAVKSVLRNQKGRNSIPARWVDRTTRAIRDRGKSKTPQKPKCWFCRRDGEAGSDSRDPIAPSQQQQRAYLVVASRAGRFHPSSPVHVRPHRCGRLQDGEVCRKTLRRMGCSIGPRLFRWLRRTATVCGKVVTTKKKDDDQQHHHSNDAPIRLQ